MQKYKSKSLVDHHGERVVRLRQDIHPHIDFESSCGQPVLALAEQFRIY
jgi:hypothetical protein